MYDNLHIWADRVIVGDGFPTIANRLEHVTETTEIETGETKISGFLDGLKVAVNGGGLSVIGSLCKYFHGTNIYTLRCKSTQKAIEQLSEALGFNIANAKVTYLEFGTSFIMSNPVTEYFKRLGYMSNMLRNMHESLTYSTRGVQDNKSFTFYDKERELRKRREPLPDGFAGLNILRYEMRFRHRLPHQLGWSEVNVGTLYDSDFYTMLVKRYQAEYFAISKQQRLQPKAMEHIKNPSDAFKVLVASLISQTNQNQIADFLDDIRAAQVLNRTELHRLKTKIQKVSEFAGYTEHDDLISELNDAILNVGVYL